MRRWLPALAVAVLPPFQAQPPGHDLRQVAPMPLPALHVQFRDPAFGARVTRITDPSQLAGLTRIRHYYSKADPFNADGSRAILFGSDGSAVLYDARDWKPLRRLRLRSGDPEIQWSPTDPAVFHYLEFAGNSPNVRAMMRYDVRDDSATLLRDFAEYDTVRARNEGNTDREGRYYAMVGGKGGRLEAFVYDIARDLVGPKRTVTEAMADDWISMSPSGRYVVMMGKDRSRVFDREMNLVRELPKGSFGHGDVCRLADGREALVYDGADHQLDGNRNVNIADLATGETRIGIRIGWRSTPHISCRNHDLPGWALVSTQGPDPKYPNHDFEVFWMRLDGSGEVRRLAHHRSDRAKGGYFAEPHAVSNRAGDRVVFASNWGGTAPISDYLVELEAGSSFPDQR